MDKITVIKLIIYAAIAAIAIIILAVKLVKTHALSQLTSTLEEAIKNAEASGAPGAEKKAYVLDAVKNKCAELDLPYALVSAAVSKLIEEIIRCYNIIAK